MRHNFSSLTRQRSKEEVILLMLCALSIPSIFPFGIVRLLQRNWLLAFVDMTIVAGMICVFLYVFKTGRVRWASVLVTIFYSAGMLTVIFIKGAPLVYWVYPTMIAAYFMLKAHEALLINSVSLIAMLVSLYGKMEMINLSSVAITIILINLFSYIFSYRTNLQHKELNRQAERDFLTGVGNRRALDRCLEKLASPADAHLESCILLFDLDHFKNVNDQFGHIVGDQVLVKLCELISSRVRHIDRVFRYGGEEFVVITVGANLQAASRLAEELRALVEAAPLIIDFPITVSIGVAKINYDETGVSWFKRADAMLYEAKQAGRNLVRVASE